MEAQRAAATGPASRGVTIDWLVPIYDPMCRVMGIGSSLRRRTLVLAKARRGEKVLDVGCGTGVLTRLAAETVGPDGAAVGIDPGPAMIERARRNAARAGSRASFELAGIEELPFADDSFDLVLSSLMLHHLPPDLKRTGLGEVRRVLRPGGRVLVFDIDRAQPMASMMIGMMRMVPGYRHALHGIGDPADLLRAAGFEEVAKLEVWRGMAAFWSANKPAAAAR